MVLRGILEARRAPTEESEAMKSVSGGTMVGAEGGHASTNTSALSAVANTMLPLTAHKIPTLTPEPINASCKPRRFRGFLWADDEAPVTPLAMLSETLRPLPYPPDSELDNPVSRKTVRENPHLFKIVTPINVDVFESLLDSHPNRPLVDSVCYGLRNGFWPFAEPELGVFPETLEMSNGLLNHEATHYILDYIAEEVAEERYSESFGAHLLPGMYAMPVYAIPKPQSNKLRLINNHSAGTFSLNAMIDKEKVGMRPDNIQDLARNLSVFRARYGQIPLQLFKSDASKAYRQLPMHPHWQLK